MSWARGLLLAALLLTLLPLGLGSLLLVLAETRPGRLSGALAASVFLAVVGLLAAIALPGTPRPALALTSLSILSALGVLLALVRLPPPEPPHADLGLIALRLDSPAQDDPGPGWLPERDRLKLATTVLARLAPTLGSAEGRRIRETIMPLAREAHAANPLAPVSHLALAGLFGWPGGTGHGYAYIPPVAPGERLGAILFLHGDAGNFQTLAWAWKPLADRRHLAILCPSYGFGFWGPGGVSVVERFRLASLARFPIDPNRVYLAGLSDGGNGVTRVASAAPQHYRGLIYISPTMNPRDLIAPAFAQGWKSRSVLVFQGGRDRNVTPASVAAGVALMNAQGVDVTFDVVPEETHFLFLGHRDWLFRRLEAWLDAQELPPHPAQDHTESSHHAPTPSD